MILKGGHKMPQEEKCEKSVFLMISSRVYYDREMLTGIIKSPATSRTTRDQACH